MAKEDAGVCGDGACNGCELGQKLNCRYDPALVRSFVLSQLPYLLLAIFCLALAWAVAGSWSPLLVFVVAGLAFLGPVEMRFLCSHCPFYARKGRWLKCMAPNPFPKLWRYRPGPMNVYEKLIIVAFAVFILSYPLIVHAHTIAFMAANRELFSSLELLAAIGLGLAAAVACIQFCYILTRRFCARCVNLSCPFNQISKAAAENYLDKNQEMGMAWKNWR